MLFNTTGRLADSTVGNISEGDTGVRVLKDVVFHAIDYLLWVFAGRNMGRDDGVSY